MTPAEAWAARRVDGEMFGHSPAQVIGFASEMADLEDCERSRWSSPSVISPAPEPLLLGWWRRRFG